MNGPDCTRVHEVLSPKESDVFTEHGRVSFEFHTSTKATHKIKNCWCMIITMLTLIVIGELLQPLIYTILYMTVTTPTWTGPIGRTHL